MANERGVEEQAAEQKPRNGESRTEERNDDAIPRCRYSFESLPQSDGEA